MCYQVTAKNFARALADYVLISQQMVSQLLLDV
jgi:hypothetical protein